MAQYAQVPASTKVMQALLRESAAAAPKVDLSSVPLDDGADEWDDDEEIDLFQGALCVLTQISMAPAYFLTTWTSRRMRRWWMCPARHASRSSTATYVRWTYPDLRGTCLDAPGARAPRARRNGPVG